MEIPRLPIDREGHGFGVNVIVEPIGVDNVTAMVVLFQDAGFIADSTTEEDARLVSDEHVQRLEAELRLTKDRLQATIEELESTNEELKSSNEEYQSINEELQSANEELETSKEELQSVNEELQTVNGELAHRVGELARTNSDLKNLLESTQIATVFLDNDLRVRSFTPAATDIFHLLETDVGRPIDHVASRVAYAELEDDVRKVLKSLAATEREVKGADGRHFIVRVLPYRSIDNFIAGAVVTFMNVTAAVRAKELQQTLIAELQHRTRNLLAIVRSISQQSIRNSGSLEEFGREFSDRLAALSRVQGLLSKGDGYRVSLAHLVTAELEAHGATIDGSRVAVEGPNVSLSAREVQVLTLALHELATNAAKYGALSDGKGRLAVRWTAALEGADKTVQIRWEESGVAMPTGTNSLKRGFGRELIERALPYDLGAETSFGFAEDGVRCEISLPLDSRDEGR